MDSFRGPMANVSLGDARRALEYYRSARYPMRRIKYCVDFLPSDKTGDRSSYCGHMPRGRLASLFDIAGAVTRSILCNLS